MDPFSTLGLPRRYEIDLRQLESRYRELHAAGHSVVLVSHDPNIISAFCTRALLLERGRIMMDGDPAVVCSAYDSATAHQQDDVFE